MQHCRTQKPTLICLEFSVNQLQKWFTLTRKVIMCARSRTTAEMCCAGRWPVCSPAHAWCLHISKYQECWSLAVTKDFTILTWALSGQHTTPGHRTLESWSSHSQSTDAHRVEQLLLCPDSPIPTVNKSYILWMVVVPAHKCCPAITISNNNSNRSPSLPITQNTFNHCRQKKKKDQYLIFQLFRYIRL